MVNSKLLFCFRYHELNLIHFMTAGQQEVRCWTVFNGAVAPQVCRWLLKPDRTARVLLAIQTKEIRRIKSEPCVHTRSLAERGLYSYPRPLVGWAWVVSVSYPHALIDWPALGPGWVGVQAAGVIHSDFERGFIKAEVCAYDDFKALATGVCAAYSPPRGVLSTIHLMIDFELW
jgi:hypothetical protein